MNKYPDTSALLRQYQNNPDSVGPTGMAVLVRDLALENERLRKQHQEELQAIKMANQHADFARECLEGAQEEIKQLRIERHWVMSALERVGWFDPELGDSMGPPPDVGRIVERVSREVQRKQINRQFRLVGLLLNLHRYANRLETTTRYKAIATSIRNIALERPADE